MFESFVSIQRVKEQLEALNDQERDALQFLTIGCNVHLHDQIVRLISRIREDRERLRGVMNEASSNGREYVRWNELHATGPESNVIVFTPRPT